ncbi:MAG: hypothetical protein AAF402_07790 [Pseudomonadota bacterium]
MNTSTLNSVLLATALSVFSIEATAYSDRPAYFDLNTDHKIVVADQLKSHQGTRLYLQEGSITAGNKVFENEPYCYFRVDRNESEQEKPVVIEFGEFDVTSVTNRRHFTMTTTDSPLQVASGGGFSFLGGGGSQYTLATHISLQSANQPEVLSLNCAIWADPRERRHLSMQEIENALGDLVRIRT